MFTRLGLSLSALSVGLLATGGGYIDHPAAATKTSPYGTLAFADSFFNEPLLPSDARSSKVVGQVIFDRLDLPIGEVQDLLLDEDGRIFAAVVAVPDLSGANPRRVAIPFRSLRLQGSNFLHRHLTVDIEASGFRFAPSFAPDGAGDGGRERPSIVRGASEIADLNLQRSVTP